MKYNLQWLLEKSEANGPLDFLFFWGHQPSVDGSITRSCLSQWWESPFSVEGTWYATAEHWMMVQKALLFGDLPMVTAILKAETPLEAKKLGKRVAGFDEYRWRAEGYDLVAQGNFHKFSQNASLGNFLLGTGQKILVEASPHDTVWGIGLEASSTLAQNPATWMGENLLGFALMEVRDLLGQNHSLIN